MLDTRGFSCLPLPRLPLSTFLTHVLLESVEKPLALRVACGQQYVQFFKQYFMCVCFYLLILQCLIWENPSRTHRENPFLVYACAQ